MWLTEGCQEPQLWAGDCPLFPQVNSEYYTGWLDYWGEAHASTSSVQVAQGLEDMLQLGASVNMQVVSWQGTQPEGGDALPSASIGAGITARLSPAGLGQGEAGRAGTAGAAGRGQCLVSPCWVCGVLMGLPGVSRRYMFHGGTNFAYWSGE